jgi:hypothetical protein
MNLPPLHRSIPGVAPFNSISTACRRQHAGLSSIARDQRVQVRTPIHHLMGIGQRPVSASRSALWAQPYPPIAAQDRSRLGPAVALLDGGASPRCAVISQPLTGSNASITRTEHA